MLQSNNIQFYRLSQLKQQLSVSRSSIWAWVKEGTFPKPIKISERVTCWKVGTVRAWMAAQGSQSYNPAVIAKKRIKGIELATA